jgi:proline iminopeptidase
MTTSVNGAELYYSTRGDGPTCLVLSAIGTRPYERQIPTQLSAHLRLAYVDLRGGGRSTGEPADLTFDVLAEDLEAVRVDLGVERVAVLGHSILGVLAIEYGRRRPASVSNVIAVGTPPYGDVARVAAEGARFFEEDASEDRKQVLRENLARLPAGASVAETLSAHTPMRFFDARFDPAPLFAEAVHKPRLLEHLMGTLTPGWDITVGSGSLRVPLFIALGRHDYIVPWVLWNAVAARLPATTLQIFQRSGHQPFFEEPDRFTTTVTSWMSQTSGR